MRWVAENERATGLPVDSHVAKNRVALTVNELAAVVPVATALRPLKKFLVPAHLDGSAGAFRGAPGRCLLLARIDYAAIAAWLASKQAHKAGKAGNLP